MPYDNNFNFGSGGQEDYEPEPQRNPRKIYDFFIRKAITSKVPITQLRFLRLALEEKREQKAKALPEIHLITHELPTIRIVDSHQIIDIG